VYFNSWCLKTPLFILPVVLVEKQQQKVPSMYSEVMKAVQDKTGLVIDDVTVKIDREEEEETFGRGQYAIPASNCNKNGC
jgi:hypothetical protein